MSDSPLKMGVWLRKVGQFGPGAGVDVPKEAGKRRSGDQGCVMPLCDRNHSLRCPVLVILIVFSLEQNAKSARAVRSVESGTERVGEFVLHAVGRGLLFRRQRAR